MLKKLMIVLLLVCLSSLAYAGKADDLSKEANNLIRNAENSFFNGKFQEADTILNQALIQLNALKSEDPDHRSIKTLDTKYQRLKVRVDQKLSPGSPAPKSTSAPATAKPDDGSKELTSGARQTLTSADEAMDAFLLSLGEARESLTEDNFNMFGSRLYRAENHLKRAKELLDRAQRTYKIAPDQEQIKPLYERYSELEQSLNATKEEGEARKGQAAARKQQAAEKTATLDEEWLPRINDFIRPTGSHYIDYPMTHDLPRLAEQDRTLEKAKTLLADYEKEVPPESASFQLQKAAKDLGFAIDNYLSQRKAGIGNMSRVIEDELAQWEKGFEANKVWKEDSGRSLFIVRPEKVNDLKSKIEKFKTVSPTEAAAFSTRLGQLEKENTGWVEKRTAWENRPRPFPEAKMASQALEKEMINLLKDRGWKVEKLVIVDKDWWVLKGEYRYMQAAALSRDREGPFWSYVNFKQNQTLVGYGPTELWEIKRKIRLP